MSRRMSWILMCAANFAAGAGIYEVLDGSVWSMIIGVASCVLITAAFTFTPLRGK